MSDTTVTTTPPAGGVPASQGTRSEIPINPNPTTTPTPLSGQAPGRSDANPDAQPPSGRPQSRREAIQAAFDKARSEQARTERRPQEPPKPAQSPPKKEAKAEPEPLNLKKRPSEQGQEYTRGERGRFAPRQPTDAQAAPDGQVAPKTPVRPDAATQQQVRQLPANAPFRDAPQRMSDQAKAAWADTPETVRGDIYRMHQEFGQAYQAYKADNDAMNEIRHFQQMAKQHGTTLKQALENYTGMEQLLIKDTIGGLERLVYNLNLKADNGNRVTLRDIAHYVMMRTPEQMAQVQQGNQQRVADSQIGQLHQVVQSLQQTVQQMHTTTQFKETRSGVDQFADTHPRFDELGDIIHEEVSRGYSLEEAYARAELLRPAAHAAQTRAQSAQTRESDRSISGAPANGQGFVPAPAREEGNSGKSVGRREAIGNAIRKVNGRR